MTVDTRKVVETFVPPTFVDGSACGHPQFGFPYWCRVLPGRSPKRPYRVDAKKEVRPTNELTQVP